MEEPIQEGSTSSSQQTQTYPEKELKASEKTLKDRIMERIMGSHEDEDGQAEKGSFLYSIICSDYLFAG